MGLIRGCGEGAAEFGEDGSGLLEFALAHEESGLEPLGEERGWGELEPLLCEVHLVALVGEEGEAVGLGDIFDLGFLEGMEPDIGDIGVFVEAGGVCAVAGDVGPGLDEGFLDAAIEVAFRASWEGIGEGEGEDVGGDDPTGVGVSGEFRKVGVGVLEGESRDDMERGDGFKVLLAGLFEVEFHGCGVVCIAAMESGFEAEAIVCEFEGIDEAIGGEVAGLLEEADGFGAVDVFPATAEHEGGPGGAVASVFFGELEQLGPGFSGLAEVGLVPGDGSVEVEGEFLWDTLGCGGGGMGNAGGQVGVGVEGGVELGVALDEGALCGVVLEELFLG